MNLSDEVTSCTAKSVILNGVKGERKRILIAFLTEKLHKQDSTTLFLVNNTDDKDNDTDNDDGMTMMITPLYGLNLLLQITPLFKGAPLLK